MPPFKAPAPTPPAKKLGPIRAMVAFATNPVRFWPEEIYETGVLRTDALTRAFIHIAEPSLARRVLLDDAESYGRSDLVGRIVRPALGRSMLLSDGAEWRRQRRIAAPVFRAEVVESFAPEMIAAGEAAATRLLGAAANAGVADVMPEAIRATYDVIADAVLSAGDFAHDKAQLQRDVALYLETVGRVDPLDLLGAPRWAPQPWKWSGLAAVKRVRRTVAELVRHRRHEAGLAAAPARPSLTDLLITAADPEEGGALDEARVVDNVLTFISAGHETSALALTWALYLVSESPEVQEALCAEREAVVGAAPLAPEHLSALALHKAVIQEALRLYPPAAVVARTALRSTTLGEMSIKPKDHVTIAVYPLHRRPALWDAPESFQPDRFLGPNAPPDRFSYMPFGAGPQICIGASFALLETTAMLAAILGHVRLAPGPARTIEPVLRVTLRPKGGMPLALAPR